MPFWKRHAKPASQDTLHLFVGLGNPGARYARTRHNVGFQVIELLARHHALSFRTSRQSARCARGTIDGIPVLLALPLTFMNESGYPVSRLVDYFRVDLKRLLIVCDDMDIPFGSLRLRERGSSGGHNGLLSVINALGTEEFARLRIGVGRPEREAIGHVLGTFSPDQATLLPALIEIAANAVTSVLKEGIAPAMNAYNKDWCSALVESANVEG